MGFHPRRPGRLRLCMQDRRSSGLWATPTWTPWHIGIAASHTKCVWGRSRELSLAIQDRSRLQTFLFKSLQWAIPRETDTGDRQMACDLRAMALRRCPRATHSPDARAQAPSWRFSWVSPGVKRSSVFERIASAPARARGRWGATTRGTLRHRVPRGPSNQSACLGTGQRGSDSMINCSSVIPAPRTAAAAATAACAMAGFQPSPVSAALACVPKIVVPSRLVMLTPAPAVLMAAPAAEPFCAAWTYDVVARIARRHLPPGSPRGRPY
jgi:hypothetical protein